MHTVPDTANPIMRGLLGISLLIDTVNTWIGKSIRWLILVAVLVSAGNALSRKFLSMSNNAMLEMQWYLFGTVFFLCSAYVLLNKSHVRIDLIQSKFPRRVQIYIELFGHIFFLMPFVLLMTYEAHYFFFSSFYSGERSSSAGGLIIWPARFVMYAGFILLLIQGISEIIKTVAILSGAIRDPEAEQEEPA